MGENVLNVPAEVVLLAAVILLGLVLLAVLVLWIKLNRLQKRYMRMMNGMEQVNVEEVLLKLQEQWLAQQARSEMLSSQLERMQDQISGLKGYVGLHRFNAFSERGSDLSFSVAIVDEKLNGVVLSGIHNREQTFMYAKPLEQGNSSYALSPEEKEAINRSLQGMQQQGTSVSGR